MKDERRVEWIDRVRERREKRRKSNFGKETKHPFALARINYSSDFNRNRQNMSVILVQSYYAVCWSLLAAGG